MKKEFDDDDFVNENTFSEGTSKKEKADGETQPFSNGIKRKLFLAFAVIMVGISVISLSGLTKKEPISLREKVENGEAASNDSNTTTTTHIAIPDGYGADSSDKRQQDSSEKSAFDQLVEQQEKEESLKPQPAPDKDENEIDADETEVMPSSKKKETTLPAGTGGVGVSATDKPSATDKAGQIDIPSVVQEEKIAYEPIKAILESDIADIESNLQVQLGNSLYSLPFVYSSLPKEVEIETIDNAPYADAPMVLQGGEYHIVGILLGGNKYILKTYMEEDATLNASSVVGISEKVDSGNKGHFYTMSGLCVGMDASHLPETEETLFNSYLNVSENYYGKYDGYSDKSYIVIQYDKVIDSIEIFKNY